MASPAYNTQQSETALSHREDGLRRRVLYAEDQPTARVVTTALLERMGFEVVAVEDGERALEQAKLGAYDVILLDIEMPVMDGVTAARQIRSDAALCRGAPILALSAFLADSTEHCQWRDAFDCALPKPANSNELKEAMRKAIARSAEKPAAAIPANEALWHSFGRNLSKGTVAMLVKTAQSEMQHLINSLAACLEAGDAQGAALCRYGLLSLSRSFAAETLEMRLSDSPSPDYVANLLHACEDWYLRSMPQ